MDTIGAPDSTISPPFTITAVTVPATGATISVSIFIASITTTVCPAETASPTLTFTPRIFPGIGASTEVPPAGAAAGAGAGAGAGRAREPGPVRAQEPELPREPEPVPLPVLRSEPELPPGLLCQGDGNRLLSRFRSRTSFHLKLQHIS